MIYIRGEGGTIHQGFNFYPLIDEGSFGCQMLFWKLRVEVRYSKRTKKLRLGWWLTQPVEHAKEQLIYIPGQTEELKKLYEGEFSGDGRKYEDWEHDPEVEKRREWEQKERNRIRDELRGAAQL
jgi:hypothetical protein